MPTRAKVYVGLLCVLALSVLIASAKHQTPHALGIETGVPGVYTEADVLTVEALPGEAVFTGTLRLHNRGRSSYTYVGATPSCSCAVVATHGELLPGAQMELRVRVENYARRQSKAGSVRVVVRSEAGTEYSTVLRIATAVDETPRLVALPHTLDLGSVTVGCQLTRTVYLYGDPAVLAAIPGRVCVELGRGTELSIPATETTAAFATKRVVMDIRVPIGSVETVESVVRIGAGSFSLPVCIVKIRAKITEGNQVSLIE